MDIGNTLYVVTPGAALRLDHDTVRVEVDGATTLRVPLLRLSSIVCFGAIALTPPLVERCADDGRSITLLDRNGGFHARVEGRTKGNVLLRRAQHIALSDPYRPSQIARQITAGKLQNSRSVLLRAVREASDEADRAVLARAAEFLAESLLRLRDAGDLNVIRGIEGDAARTYWRHGARGSGRLRSLRPHPPPAAGSHQRAALIPLRTLAVRV